MATTQVSPVRSKKAMKDFLRVPWKIYQDDPLWVPPLLHELKGRLNRRKNPYFDHAIGEYFVAYQEGQPVGRITAQIDRLYNAKYSERTGFFGFFETVDDAAVSSALIAAASAWLGERGMDRIRGPFSLSINEESGLLVDGYEYAPYVMMGHNPRYYRDHLEAVGFNKIKDLYCWRYDAKRPVPEAAMQIAEQVRQYPGLSIRELNMKNYKSDMRLMLDIFNSAFANNWGFVPITGDEIDKVGRDMRMVLDKRLALIAEVNGEPAAIAIAVPNINEAIQDLDGRLLPFGFMKFLYRLKARKIGTARLTLLGVKKEFRGDILGGLAVLLYSEMHRRGSEIGYSSGELSWTLEDNKKINFGIEMMGGERYKTYRIFEKALS